MTPSPYSPSKFWQAMVGTEVWADIPPHLPGTKHPVQIQRDTPGMILRAREQQSLSPGKRVTSRTRLAPASVSARVRDPALEDVSDPRHSTKVTQRGKKGRR